MQQASAKDTRLLFDSFDLARRYGHEYIDQNPLQGEPGSFVFSSTHEQLRTRQKQEELVRLKALKEAKPSAPPALQVDTKAVPTARKGSEAEISPKTATTAAGKLKRRKSKAPVTPTES